MRVREGRKPARQSSAREKSYQGYSFPGPTLGWVSDHNLAVAQPGGAYVLDNIFPTATGGILRRGCQKRVDLNTAEILTPLTGTFAITEESTTVAGTDTLAESELEKGSIIKIGGVNYTVDTITSDTSFTIEEEAEASLSGQTAHLVTYAPGEVKSLFAFQLGSVEKLFAGVDGQIWDITVPGTATQAHTVTNGYWSVAQYTASDGSSYLRGVNGVDTPWTFDGTDFSTTDKQLTFPGGATTAAEALVYTWVHKNRFFFIEAGTLDAWYLDVGAISGELTKFPLGGIFSLGGELVFGSTWSLETGDGLSSMCVFVTSNGEVAVYAGDDPGEAESWYKVGVYQIGKPKGPNCFFRRGGDLVIATDIGAIPLSQALQKDAVTLSPSAMSAHIEDEWNEYSRTRGQNWSAVTWTEGQMVAFALPTGSGQTPTWLVANARTGRWARYTGWNANCLISFAGSLYFGSPDGCVYEANVGGSDDGLPYVGVYVPSFDQLGVKGIKAPALARPVLRARRQVNIGISVHNDFRLTLPPSPPASAEGTGDVWGVAKWGEMVWGADSSDAYIQDDWCGVMGQGEALTIAHQITSSSNVPLDAEFVRTDVLFTSGEMQI